MTIPLASADRDLLYDWIDESYRNEAVAIAGPHQLAYRLSRCNPAHFDLTCTSLEDQQRTVATALELGARHIDIGQRPEEGHVVLADPEGNEFCVRDQDEETAIRSRTAARRSPGAVRRLHRSSARTGCIRSCSAH